MNQYAKQPNQTIKPSKELANAHMGRFAPEVLLQWARFAWHEQSARLSLGRSSGMFIHFISSPELVPLSIFLHFWGSLCFPLITRQNKYFFAGVLVPAKIQHPCNHCRNNKEVKSKGPRGAETKSTTCERTGTCLRRGHTAKAFAEGIVHRGMSQTYGNNTTRA